MDLAGIERLQRNQPVRDRIVQLTVDARAFVIAVLMTAVLCDIFLLQGTNLQNENRFCTEETIY